RTPSQLGAGGRRARRGGRPARHAHRAEPVSLDVARSAAAAARTVAAGDGAAVRRLFGLGPRPARSGARSVGVADERRRSRPDLQYAAGQSVGDGNPPARRRSVGADDVARSALSRGWLLGLGLAASGSSPWTSRSNRSRPILSQPLAPSPSSTPRISAGPGSSQR